MYSCWFLLCWCIFILVYIRTSLIIMLYVDKSLFGLLIPWDFFFEKVQGSNLHRLFKAKVRLILWPPVTALFHPKTELLELSDYSMYWQPNEYKKPRPLKYGIALLPFILSFESGIVPALLAALHAHCCFSRFPRLYCHRRKSSRSFLTFREFGVSRLFWCFSKHFSPC